MPFTSVIPQEPHFTPITKKPKHHMAHNPLRTKPKILPSIKPLHKRGIHVTPSLHLPTFWQRGHNSTALHLTPAELLPDRYKQNVKLQA